MEIGGKRGACRIRAPRRGGHAPGLVSKRGHVLREKHHAAVGERLCDGGFSGDIVHQRDAAGERLREGDEVGARVRKRVDHQERRLVAGRHAGGERIPGFVEEAPRVGERAAALEMLAPLRVELMHGAGGRTRRPAVLGEIKNARVGALDLRRWKRKGRVERERDGAERLGQRQQARGGALPALRLGVDGRVVGGEIVQVAAQHRQFATVGVFHVGHEFARAGNADFRVTVARLPAAQRAVVPYGSLVILI